MCLKQNTSRYNDLQPRCIMDVADRRHKRFEEALRRKLDCVVPRFHWRIASITMRKQAGFATNTQFAPIHGITDHAERGRNCKPLRITTAREREQKERQRIHCTTLPVTNPTPRSLSSMLRSPSPEPLRSHSCLS
jgi:hypothetical protein